LKKQRLNRRLTKIIRSIIILIACGFPLAHLHCVYQQDFGFLFSLSGLSCAAARDLGALLENFLRTERKHLKTYQHDTGARSGWLDITIRDETPKKNQAKVFDLLFRSLLFFRSPHAPKVEVKWKPKREPRGHGLHDCECANLSLFI
jgi:hypothetical protein